MSSVFGLSDTSDILSRNLSLIFFIIIPAFPKYTYREKDNSWLHLIHYAHRSLLSTYDYYFSICV